MSLQGILSKYHVKPHVNYPYFRSGDLSSKKVVVFIGGLTNGFMDPGYLVGLSGDLGGRGWGLVQMYWSGCYEGFATGDLDRDRDEMVAMVNHLRKEGFTKIVLMGHSTGSQNVIHYLSSPTPLPQVQGGIMQAPCSDRQFFEKEEKERLDKGEGSSEVFTKLEEGWRAVEEGRGGEILVKDFAGMGMGITARRLVDLCAVGLFLASTMSSGLFLPVGAIYSNDGAKPRSEGLYVTPDGNDDYFSDDIPYSTSETPNLPHQHLHPLSSSFGALSAPALALWSENDEYGVQPDREGLNKRWVDASRGLLEVVVIKGEGANHAVEGEKERIELGRAVGEWLKKFD